MNLSNNMKKYLIGGFSVIILGLAVSVYAQSSPSISSFWGVQDLESKYGQLVIMDIPVDPTALMNLANPAQGLDDLKLYVDTALSVFSDVKSSGKVFVTGCEDSYDGRVRFGSSIVDTSACASVNGDLLATDFTAIGNTTDRYLCANANGVVELCSENPNYTCTGSAPTNASMCSGDSAGLTSNTPVTLAGVCGTPKCEYTCNTNFYLENGACVPTTTYHWEVTSWGQCTTNSGLKTRTVRCIDSFGTSVADNLCVQNNISVTGTLLPDVNSDGIPDRTQSCSFGCTGTVPNGETVICPGDNTGLTADTPRTLVSSCGTPKCEYSCTGDGHTIANGQCVCAPSWYSCPGITSGCGEVDGGCCRSCSGIDSFLPGTTIRMADGTLMDVINVKIGEKIITSGGIGTITKKYVYETDARVYRMETDNYFVTASHPFMTTEGWKSFDPIATRKKVPSIVTNLLEIGDTLIMENGEHLILTNTDSIPGPHKVYNFSVDGTHDFYANGYLVHNK